MKATRMEDDGYDGSEYSLQEIAALDEYFKRYTKIANLYNELILLEENLSRKELLELMLCDLHEENK
jgi:hypothetical protein